jgi:hypothetical protein
MKLCALFSLRVGSVRAALALVPICGLGACASVPGGHEWGADATYRPGWDRVERSAIAAARDPWVWGPLLAAGAVQIDNADHRISDWAREHTPVFGSQENAARRSDDLRSASTVAYFGTVLATPGGDFGSTWVENKFKGWLVGFAAWTATKRDDGRVEIHNRPRAPRRLRHEELSLRARLEIRRHDGPGVA